MEGISMRHRLMALIGRALATVRETPQFSGNGEDIHHHSRGRNNYKNKQQEFDAAVHTRRLANKVASRSRQRNRCLN